MNAAGRLSLYGAGVVVAFGGAFGIAAAVVPDSAVANWTEKYTAPSVTAQTQTPVRRSFNIRRRHHT